MAAPAVAEERSLVDDVGALAQCGNRLSIGLLERSNAARRQREFDDALPFCPQLGQVLGLVLQAATSQQVQFRIMALRARDLATGRPELLLSEVLTLQVTRQI